MATLWHQTNHSFSTNCSIFNHIQSTPVFCIACEKKFPDKASLEDHACPAVSFICTCGMGFTDYLQMLSHRNEHNVTNSFQSDHISIMNDRTKDAKLREIKLRMLESIDQKLRHAQNLKLSKPFTAQRKPAPSAAPFCTNMLLKAPPTSSVSPVKIKITPTTPVSSSGSSLPSVTPFSSSLKSVPFTNFPVPPEAAAVPRSGATVNLSRQFQPVVLLGTKVKFGAGGPHMCATCRVVVWDKNRLVEHVASHFFVYVYGCSRCGILLLGNSPLPSHHCCGVYYASNKDRFTTGHIINGAAASHQKQSILIQCPYCPMKYYELWHLKRHTSAVHPNRDMLCLPQITPKAVTEMTKQKVMASVTSGQIIRKSEKPIEKVTGVPGWKMISGMVTCKGPQRDGNMLQQTVENGMKAEIKKPEAPLEMITYKTGGTVAEGRVMKVAQGLENLNQQSTMVETGTEKWTLNQFRCVICGKNLRTVQMLGQHWCSRKLTLLRQEKLQSMPLKFTDDYRGSLSRSSPYPVAGRDSGRMVTVRLQTSHNTEICKPALTNIKVEPCELSCTGLYKSVAVQTKVECDDGCYNAPMNLQSMPLKFTDSYRGSLSRTSPYSVARRDSGKMVTFRVQTSHNTEICKPLFTNSKVEPCKLSCTGLLKSVVEQTKVDCDDGRGNAVMNPCIVNTFPTKV